MKIMKTRTAGAIGASVLLTTGVIAAGQSLSPVPAAGSVTGPATGASAAVPAAPAGPDPAEVAAQVTKRLGSRTAGAYLDKQGHAVVTITRDTDAATVRALGATPKKVARSGADLLKVDVRLRKDIKTRGVAWSTDPVTAQVVVKADSTYKGTRLARLQQVVKSQGGAARLERMPGRLTTMIAGGDAIYGGGYRCSLGFNVHRGRYYYFLTAGHCTNEGTTWSMSNGQIALGSRVGTSFPYNDYGIVRYTNSRVVKSGMVRLYNGRYRDIRNAGNAVVGQTVYRSGSTTGLHSGIVTGLNTTVNYWSGETVYGMIQTSVCAEPGDSGGPLFRGYTGLGLLSGGSGDCSEGGETFYQPLLEVTRRYGVYVY